MSGENGLFGGEAPPMKKRAPQESALGSEWHSSTKAERQEFFLPVSGFVWFYPEEMKIIDHPAFQRLSLINQLGQAYYVYRGATHKRIEHVLGVVGVVQEMISAIKNTSNKGKFKNDRTFAPPLSKAEERFVRLGALLHDIGHVAAGHTLEDELEVIGKHDADERITLVFDKADWDGPAAKSLGALIDEQFANYVPKTLSGKIAPQVIARLLIRKRPKSGVDTFAEAQRNIETSPDIRFDLCSNMIGNTICADLLDYIYRDWYHIGKTRSKDDRIFQYMELRRQASGRIPEQYAAPDADSPSSNDRYVIALGKRAKVRSDGVSSILGLLEWRYELAEAVLFHRTKVASGAMLDRALFLLWGSGSKDDLIKKILSVSDDQLLEVALQDSRVSPTEESSEIAAGLLSKLKSRNIYSTLATFDSSILSDVEVAQTDRLYRSTSNDKASANNRCTAARNLEKDFNLPAGAIVIYCLNVSAKLAEVSVAIDEEITSLVSYERRNGDKLSGGHLIAQVNRFKMLWRIHFFIDEIVEREIGKAKTEEIRQFIRQVLLSVDQDSSLNMVVERFAFSRQQKAAQDGNNSVRVKKTIPEFAKGVPGTVDTVRYPNGVSCLQNFFETDG